MACMDTSIESIRTKEEAVYSYLQTVFINFDDENEVEKIKAALKPKKKAKKKGNK